MKLKLIIALSLGTLALFSCKESNVTTTESIKSDIVYLASDSLEGRESGTKGERLAAEYIAKRMQEIGYVVDVVFELKGC